MSKDDYVSRSRILLIAFQKIAEDLGKEHLITKLMGALAWGRHGAECGPDGDNIRGRAVEYGYLRGCRSMLVKVSNELSLAATLTINNTMQQVAIDRGHVGGV